MGSLLRKQSTPKRDATVQESGARAGARIYCSRKFLESKIIAKGVGTLFAKAEQHIDQQQRKKKGKVFHIQRYFLS